jgi:hypothetical protein
MKVVAGSWVQYGKFRASYSRFDLIERLFWPFDRIFQKFVLESDKIILAP